MAILLDGKATAAAVRESVRLRAAKLRERGVAPCLAVVLVGEDPASCVYVRNKERACAEVGIESRMVRLPESTPQAALLAEIRKLNVDPAVHAILVQLPLPKGLDETAVLEEISPEKDADGFHPMNVGRLAQGQKGILPCTPAGILTLLDAYRISCAGKHCVVVGRSHIVGRPMARLLLDRDATVTVCHSRTPDLARFTREADLLIAAVGKPGVICRDMVKPGAVVVDVGINRVNGKLCGDVEEAVDEVASYRTPVPGGVGPMTVAQLMKNTVEIAEKTI